MSNAVQYTGICHGHNTCQTRKAYAYVQALLRPYQRLYNDLMDMTLVSSHVDLQFYPPTKHPLNKAIHLNHSIAHNLLRMSCSSAYHVTAEPFCFSTPSRSLIFSTLSSPRISHIVHDDLLQFVMSRPSMFVWVYISLGNSPVHGDDCFDLVPFPCPYAQGGLAIR